MKRLLLLTTALLLLSMAYISANGTEENSSIEMPHVTAASAKEHVLVVYFSRTGENYHVGVIEKGNTEIVAEIINKRIQGTIFQLQTKVPYPTGYQECTDVARQEQAVNARPALSKDIGIDEYDVIFLGYPIWWNDLPMAVYTFLENHDFSGKTIVPFSTHEGSGLSGTVRSISEAAPGAKIMEGLAIRGRTAQSSYQETLRTVDVWLDDLGFAPAK